MELDKKWWDRKEITVNCVGDLNVSTKFYCNPSSIHRDISAWTKVMDQQTNTAICTATLLAQLKIKK